MGEGFSRDGARTRHDDRVEADCGYGGREDRQRTPYLRAGSGGGNYGYVHDWGGGLVWIAGQHDARAVFGHCGDDGGESFGIAVVDGAESGDGVGVDAAGV